MTGSGLASEQFLAYRAIRTLLRIPENVTQLGYYGHSLPRNCIQLNFVLRFHGWKQ